MIIHNEKIKELKDKIKEKIEKVDTKISISENKLKLENDKISEMVITDNLQNDLILDEHFKTIEKIKEELKFLERKKELLKKELDNFYNKPAIREIAQESHNQATDFISIINTKTRESIEKIYELYDKLIDEFALIEENNYKIESIAKTNNDTFPENKKKIKGPFYIPPRRYVTPLYSIEDFGDYKFNKASRKDKKIEAKRFERITKANKINLEILKERDRIKNAKAQLKEKAKARQESKNKVPENYKPQNYKPVENKQEAKT